MEEMTASDDRKSMKDKLTIIIPHYRDEVRLRRCLNEIGKQLRSEPSIDVIVVDNGSPEFDPDTFNEEHNWARFFVETERGAAAARNRGINEARTEHLLFVDSDCVPENGWVKAALQLCGTADIIGGKVDFV